MIINLLSRVLISLSKLLSVLWRALVLSLYVDSSLALATRRTRRPSEWSGDATSREYKNSLHVRIES